MSTTDSPGEPAAADDRPLAGIRVLDLATFIAAPFAATTLDTACRLQRYVIQELASTFAPRISPTALAAGGAPSQASQAAARERVI